MSITCVCSLGENRVGFFLTGQRWQPGSAFFAFIFIKSVLRIQVILHSRGYWGKGDTKTPGHETTRFLRWALGGTMSMCCRARDTWCPVLFVVTLCPVPQATNLQNMHHSAQITELSGLQSGTKKWSTILRPFTHWIYETKHTIKIKTD